MTSIIILAAGKGSRMNSNLPKPFHLLGNHSMIQHVVRCSKCVSDDVIIIGNPNYIKLYQNLGCKVITQNKQLGTFHALFCGLPYVKNEYVIVLNADDPMVNPNDLLNMIQLKSNAELVVKTTNPYALIEHDNMILNKIHEDVDSNDLDNTKYYYSSSGTHMFVTDEVKDITLEQIGCVNKQNEYYIGDVFNLLKTPTKIIETISSVTSNINTSEQLNKLNKLFPIKTVTVKTHGRVNLMGRHIDHQGGFIHPILTKEYMTLTLSKLPLNYFILDMKSKNDTINVIQNDLIMRNNWTRYIIAAFKFMKCNIPCEIIIDSNIPQGAGLSSSSALIVSTIKGILKINDKHVSPEELIRLSGDAEKLIVSNGGYGDHAAMIYGTTNTICKIKCVPEIKLYNRVKFPNNFRIILFHTGVKAEKATSSRKKFTSRIEMFEKGIKLLKAKYLFEIKDKLPDNEYKDILTYGLNEINRSKIFLNSLNDFNKIGELIKKSQFDEVKYYKCSCPEADDIVSISNEIDGVYGSQICGAGMGGCVAIFDNGKSNVIDILKNKYKYITQLSN